VTVNSTRFTNFFSVGRRDRFSVIPLGIDLSSLTASEAHRRDLRDELLCGDDDFVVGIVGRLCAVKDHALFIRAAAAFQASCRDHERRVRFVVIADGATRTLLEALAREVNTEFVFLGNRNDPQVFYAGIDALMLTSRNEGTPLSMLEAMAFGKPVIATLVGGVPDLLGLMTEPDNGDYIVHQRGLGVTDRKPSSLAAALARIVDDHSLRSQLATTAQEYVWQCHSKHRLTDNVVGMYEDMTGCSDLPSRSSGPDSGTQQLLDRGSMAANQLRATPF